MATAVDFTNQSFAPLKNDLILRVARGERAKRVPVWVLKQAGKYLPEYKELRGNRKFFDICKDPELVCDITVQVCLHQ
ncbi:uroporphyrinogen decarboxylase [Plakobranchus ocellatus]|uniref:Uroporphyrinogen decarboxylase n=1 Tax=Plakobranchus ocellatus TaxID=259542 RepID=A0AAV3YG28_9GAST|nr:uroporphyrinogen decarboxylase [Plakobranchus ocellatus]